MAKKYKKTSRLMQRVEQRKKGIAKERPGLKPLRAPKRKEEVVATPNNYIKRN